MKDNSIIIVLKDGIQIREPIETNNYIYKSGKVVGLLSSLSETHCLLLANLLKLIKMLCSYFVQQRHLCCTKKLQHTKSTRYCVSCAFLLLYLVFLSLDKIFEFNSCISALFSKNRSWTYDISFLLDRVLQFYNNF